MAMVAGEPSGDVLAALLLRGLGKRWPGLRVFGIGGPEMEKVGFHANWSSDKLAVRGYVEVLKHYREIVGIRKELRSRLLSQRPDLFIGVDAPDFNLELEHDLKRVGIKTVHFVCPSIWAWRAERVEKIRASVDHVLCVFPFEVELLRRRGIAASFVGHPLASVIPMEPDRNFARQALGLGQGDRVVAILPGSRLSEIKFLSECFFQAAGLLASADPGMKFIVPAIPCFHERLVVAAAEVGMSHRIQVIKGQSHLALAACDVSLIASGTATLEAALFKRPMVIAYKMNWLTWQVMKRQKLQPWVGLPNILCQDFVVPELLQDQATPTALAAEVMDWFVKPEKAKRLRETFRSMHESLKRDTALLAANAIEKVLES